jgi:hypothetical protein
MASERQAGDDTRALNAWRRSQAIGKRGIEPTLRDG